MKRALLILALGIACAGLAFAQTATTPDLSGTWKLNFAKSNVTRKDAFRPETITISTNGDTIQFHYGGEPKDRLHTYIADGKERPLGTWTETDNYGTVRVAWEKSVLVIDRTDHWPTRDPVHSSERWRLSSDGRTLTMNPDSGGKVSYVYDKQ
jgi:hypothetical protein